MENEALAIWLKAANAGHVAAQTKAGFALLESTPFGWENQRNGVAWLKKAAERNDFTAQWRLGKFLDESVNVSKNRDQAIQWYRKSAEHGNRDARARLLEMGASNVPSGDFLTCTNLGFSVRIPIPNGYEPADTVMQATLELESIVFGDSILLPVLYNSKELESPLPFTNPSCIRIMHSPGRKEFVCPDDETWERMRKEFMESLGDSSHRVTLSNSASLRSIDAGMEPFSGPGWAGRFSVVGRKTNDPLDALGGRELMFTGMARIRDRIASVTILCSVESFVDPKQPFRNTIEHFLLRLFELNRFENNAQIRKTPSRSAVMLRAGPTDKGKARSTTDPYIRQLMTEKWSDCKTKNEPKSLGLDLLVSFPSSFECRPGRNPHVLYYITPPDKTGPRAHAIPRFMVEVHRFDPGFSEMFHAGISGFLSQKELEEAADVLTGGMGTSIDCGVTKINNVPAFWTTVNSKGESLGIEFRQTDRFFFVPMANDIMLKLSFGVMFGGPIGTVGSYPTADFERFLPIGLKFISQTTFLDWSQLIP